MKTLYTLLAGALLLLCAACSSSPAARYDGEMCHELSVKIERGDSLSQADYRNMILQNEAILVYLINRTKEVSSEPSDEQAGSWRHLLAEPEYLERFGYMFTLGSALYQADADGHLDSDNKKLYDRLDRYNRELADFSDNN